MPTLPESERALRDAFPSLAAKAGADLRRLLADATRHELAAGAVALGEGQLNDALFLVCEGEVAITSTQAGTRVPVGTLGRGRWFGELGFLEAGPSTAEVVATGPTLLLSVSRAQLLAWIDAHPALADAVLGGVLAGMTQRLRTTREVVDRGVEPLNDTERPESRFVRALRAFFGGGE